MENLTTEVTSCITAFIMCSVPFTYWALSPLPHIKEFTAIQRKQNAVQHLVKHVWSKAHLWFLWEQLGTTQMVPLSFCSVLLGLNSYINSCQSSVQSCQVMDIASSREQCQLVYTQHKTRARKHLCSALHLCAIAGRCWYSGASFLTCFRSFRIL